jgi:hypothetical protein
MELAPRVVHVTLSEGWFGGNWIAFCDLRWVATHRLRVFMDALRNTPYAPEVSAVEVGRALDRLIEKERVGSDARRRSVSTMGSTV